MGHCVALAVKDPTESSSIELPIHVVDVWGDDGLVEDMACKVDVVCQDKVLVVIFGRLAEGNEILCRSDLVGVICRAAAATVFGVSRKADNANCDK